MRFGYVLGAFWKRFLAYPPGGASSVCRTIPAPLLGPKTKTRELSSKQKTRGLKTQQFLHLVELLKPAPLQQQ